MESIRVRLPADLRMNDDKFMRFCQSNSDLKFERRKNGDVIFMANSDGETGNYNFEIAARFGFWNRQAKFGKFFDSSTAFRLADTSIMSPDVAAISQSRWDALTSDERRKILHLCPDFVLELRSPSDRPKDCFEKMDDWINNGCRLGWLIDLANQTTYVYRSNQPREEITGLGVLDGEDVLPGFSLDVALLIA
ncbi:Uma2 family endonuclease [Spirosoma sp. BT702]|uniref:Uma2 family endonuclease n=1 Tax=Spirosoma profusum TaxID=2771354 RepID=A0A926Y027_9BACT|nr:Uma2 family endonuclease [Spirosoma profusum]MBD2699455.1 Uma2 family endonuclease [Spirosoma profusum]